MSRDYKPRNPEKRTGRSRSDHQPKSNMGLGLWLVGISFIILFVVGLVYIISSLSNKSPEPTTIVTSTLGIDKEISSVKEELKPEFKLEPKLPQFDFYTILPEKEVVVPEYEIKTRMREQLVGKAKNTHYVMQAGSFKTYKEAERLKIKLATMGLDSNIQKGMAGTQKWYRVNMGPYAQTDSINTIRARLRQNGIDAIITEVGDQ
jgi:hypothetical protein